VCIYIYSPVSRRFGHVEPDDETRGEQRVVGEHGIAGVASCKRERKGGNEDVFRLLRVRVNPR